MALSASIMAPAASPNVVNGFFIYKGTDTIAEGEPFVFDVTHPGEIARPTGSSDVFAGVAARDYPADSGNRQIELNLPGSHGVKICVKGSSSSTVSAGTVVLVCYKATTGSKVFKAAGSPHALTALTIGDAILREAITTDSDGLGAGKADLCIAPYTIQSES